MDDAKGAVLKIDRLWIIATGIVVAFLALLGACGSQDGTSGESHSDHDHDHSHDHGSSKTMSTVLPDDADVVIEIEFRNGVVDTPENRVSISSGDQVVFSIVSDVDELIHVHGVDLVGEVSSGESKNFFGYEIQISGIFEVEFEDSGVFITELLVN